MDLPRLATRVEVVRVCIALLSWLFAFPHVVERHRDGPLWIRVLLAVLLVLAIVGMLFVWVGMWWYWAKLDVSGNWARRFWFFVLLCGFCFGAAAGYGSPLIEYTNCTDEIAKPSACEFTRRQRATRRQREEQAKS